MLQRRCKFTLLIGAPSIHEIGLSGRGEAEENKRGGEKLGLIGLTPQDTDELASPGKNIIFTPPADAVAALQARLLLESGLVGAEELAEIAVRSQRNAVGNPNAVRSSSEVTVADVMAEAPVADPLRPSDLAAESDGGCAVVLAAGDRARELCSRPAWIRGIDHRIDAHALGTRNLTRAPSAELATSVAVAAAGLTIDSLDLAELHSPTSSQEAILVREFGLGGSTEVNPSGGALAANTMMAAGLVRIAEAADRIIDGRADRALAHATSGPCLQQNLVCVMAGE